MTLPELLIFIPAMTGAVVTIINAVKGHRRGRAVHTSMGAIGEKVNGRLEEMLNATRESARLAGYADGLRDNLKQDSGEWQRPRLP